MANSLVEIISTHHTHGGDAETVSRIAHSDFQCLDEGNELRWFASIPFEIEIRPGDEN